jgi:hypothetical protein
MWDRYEDLTPTFTRNLDLFMTLANGSESTEDPVDKRRGSGLRDTKKQLQECGCLG